MVLCEAGVAFEVSQALAPEASSLVVTAPGAGLLVSWRRPKLRLRWDYAFRRVLTRSMASSI